MTDTIAQGCRTLALLMKRHTGATVPPEAMQVVAEGASGRCIMRASLPACSGIIGIYWTPDRADNASFLPAAHGLKRAGVRVPAVLAEQDCGAGCGACLVQDLGRNSLLSLRDRPWRTRRAAYRDALCALHTLHQVTPDWEMQPAFDTALYRWEQHYFAEHFLQRHQGRENAATLIDAAPFTELAEWLATLPRRPVHRDFQSQNIMLHQGHAWLIDFQGMREGLPEYDLASLIYDPYMALAECERAELLELWSSITQTPLRLDIFAACALQRIMQALGAFANIGYNKRNPWYLSLIPAGVNALQQACATAPANSAAHRLAACLSPVISQA